MRIFRSLMTILICWLGLGLAYAQVASTPPNSDKLLWERPTGWFMPLSIAVEDAPRPILYTAQKGGGVSILKDNPDRGPKHLATIPRHSLGQMDAMKVQLSGDYLYVALGDHFSKGRKAGLAVVNVVDPKKPVVMSIWKAQSGVSGAGHLLVKGRYAYIGAMKSGVHILDISHPKAPRHLSTYLPDINFPKPNPNSVSHPNARGLDLAGNLLFVANDAGGLRVLDVSNKSAPKEVGRYINRLMNGKQQAYNKIIVDGRYAYIGVDYCGMEVVDISRLDQIKQVAWWNPWSCEKNSNFWFNSQGHVNQLALDKRKARLYMSAGDSEVIVLDVRNPRSPKHVKTYGELKNGQGAWGLTLHRGKIYAGYIQTFIPFRGRWAGIRAYAVH